VRLSGFSWLEYGAIPARVARVAEEPDSGRFRVELDLTDSIHSRGTIVPISHGLPGTIAIEVDRLTPWRLALRNVGHLVQKSAAPTSQLPLAQTQ
jgi:hypothetical protein